MGWIALRGLLLPTLLFVFKSAMHTTPQPTVHGAFRGPTKAMKLRARQGQSVDILISDREIKVINPKPKVRLWVVHNFSLFKLDECRHG